MTTSPITAVWNRSWPISILAWRPRPRSTGGGGSGRGA
jgi:hypothetical protein